MQQAHRSKLQLRLQRLVSQLTPKHELAKDHGSGAGSGIDQALCPASAHSSLPLLTAPNPDLVVDTDENLGGWMLPGVRRK